MALINLFSVYYKGLAQQKNLYPIVLQALKAKICPIVSKGWKVSWVCTTITICCWAICSTSDSRQLECPHDLGWWNWFWGIFMLIVQRITQKTTLCKNGTDELNLCILQSTGPAEKIVPDCVTSAQSQNLSDCIKSWVRTTIKMCCWAICSTSDSGQLECAHICLRSSGGRWSYSWYTGPVAAAWRVAINWGLFMQKFFTVY